MGRNEIKLFDDRKDGFLSISDLGSRWSLVDGPYYGTGGLFASVSQMGMNSDASPPGSSSSRNNGGFKMPFSEFYDRYICSPLDEAETSNEKKKKKKLKLKIKIANPSLRRLLSGGIAGAVSRTAVAPLETIRTHLMVGSSGHSTTEVFNNIMKTDGWKGLFRGNFVNVIPVAPSKAIEV